MQKFSYTRFLQFYIMLLQESKVFCGFSWHNNQNSLLCFNSWSERDLDGSQILTSMQLWIIWKHETIGFINLLSTIQQILQLLEEGIDALSWHYRSVHVHLPTECEFSADSKDINAEEFGVSPMLPSDLQRYSYT